MTVVVMAVSVAVAGGIGGGGMFVGPDNPVFGDVPGVFPPHGAFPGHLPGARFDPFGPVGPDVGGPTFGDGDLFFPGGPVPPGAGRRPPRGPAGLGFGA